MMTVSVHLLCEFSGCNCQAIADVEVVKKAMHEASAKAKATVLNGYFHQFSPSGISGVLCLAESHISVHTWPEAGYVAADIFTCGTTAMPQNAIPVLAAAFEAEDVRVTEVKRGVPLPDGTFDTRVKRPESAQFVSFSKPAVQPALTKAD